MLILLVIYLTVQDEVAQEYQSKYIMPFFQPNVQSLPKHIHDLELYIHSLDFGLFIITISENWLDAYKYDMYM